MFGAENAEADKPSVVLEPAPRQTRVIAWLLDSVFVFGSILVGTLVLYGAADAAGAPIAGEVADWAATVGMVAFPVYGALFEGGSSGATPAKQMLNLHVVDRDGAPLGYAGAAWRNLA